MKFKSINGNLAVTEDGDMVHLAFGYDKDGKLYCRTEPVAINPAEEVKDEKQVARHVSKGMTEIWDEFFGPRRYTFHTFW